MLPKKQRLAKNRIEYILKKGKKKHTHFFTVKYLSTKLPISRFCVITSLKISAKATVRNRLRRQIYEIFRLHPELPATPSDLVLISKALILQLKFAELTKNLLITLKNLNTNS